MNKLKYYRTKNKYDQKFVADYLRITQPNYSNIETGKVKLNFDYANLLAKLYKIPVSDLIDSTNNIYLTKEQLNILIEAKNIIDELEKKQKLNK